MKARIFSTEAAARAFVADLDLALGYPGDGVRIGGGIHSPPELARTLTHAAPIKHLTKNEWAVPVDERVEELATPTARGRLVSTRMTGAKHDAMRANIVGAAALPADWTPAPKSLP